MTAPKSQSTLSESTRITDVSSRVYWIVLAVIVAIGAILRFHPTAAMQERRADELIYARSTENLVQLGIGGYPDLCLRHIVQQSKMDIAMPPPTRFLYPFFGYLVRSITGWNAQSSLVFTSALFTTGSLLLAAGFLRRLAGDAVSLGVAALLATTMNQIQQAQHAMIDGFFATWALLAMWSFWELLQQSRRRIWTVVYPLSLAAMVMTKENSFFVVVALGGLLILNRWLRFGVATRQIWLLSFIGPLAGFVILVFLSGGVDVFRAMYDLQFAKIETTQWAVNNGNGPWYRYLLDLTLISPLVMLLAIGQAFQVRLKDKGLLLMLSFVLLTFSMMARIKHGLNLRYTTIWDVPLRSLAAVQLLALSARISRPMLMPLFAASIIGLAAFELNQYYIICVRFPAYALTDREVLQALEIVVK
jgi:4-amino-4-deoxy-L-arabinose transferase-like glycosyltransferase